MKHQAQIVHHVPGRVRIKLPRAKGDRILLEQIKQSISPRPGVQHVTINPATGSVVIYYDADLIDSFNKGLAAHAAQGNLFNLKTESKKEESGIARSIDVGFKQLSDGIKHATGETIDLKEMFPFAVATIALFFVDKTLGAPLWLSLLFFSFSSYMDLHEADPEPNNVIGSIESLHLEIAALRDDVRALSRKS